MKKLLFLSALTGLCLACAPEPNTPQPLAAQALNSQTVEAQPQSYELYSWKDFQTQQSLCAYAVIAEQKPADFQQRLDSVDKARVFGVAALEARLRALPKGSKLRWSDQLSFMSSRQFGLPKASAKAQILSVLEQLKISLTIDNGLQTGGDVSLSCD
jgi:hypothetical protein